MRAVSMSMMPGSGPRASWGGTIETVNIDIRPMKGFLQLVPTFLILHGHLDELE